jgi:hypothetical protein
LIQLGAGIAAGDLSKGLSKAGEVAMLGKKDARAEDRSLSALKRQIELADRTQKSALDIKTAEKGTSIATTSRKNLARIWGHVADITDGRIQSLSESKALIWMPAHQPPTAIDCRKKSNGHPINKVDWRANRLVDGLAKLAAERNSTPKAQIKLVESAEHLVRHAAAQLAVATYLANNYKVTTVGPDGETTTRTLRDSTDFKPAKKVSKGMQRLAGEAHKNEKLVDLAEGETSSSEENHSKRSQRKIKAISKRKHKKRAKEAQCKAVRDIVQAKRMTHQEAAVDWHRRQLLARTLVPAEETQSGEHWGQFLALQSTPSTASQAYSSTQPWEAAEAVSQAQATEAEARQGPLERAAAVVGSLAPPARTRPSKGEQKTSKGETQRAIEALVGTAAKKAQRKHPKGTLGRKQ